MNKEINEIFNDLKNCLSWCYEANDKTIEIHRDDALKVMQYTKELQQRIDKAIEWCDAVINSEFTYDKLPNGDYTDMGYCLALAKPLLKILKGDEE